MELGMDAERKGQIAKILLRERGEKCLFLAQSVNEILGIIGHLGINGKDITDYLVNPERLGAEKSAEVAFALYVAEILLQGVKTDSSGWKNHLIGIGLGFGLRSAEMGEFADSVHTAVLARAALPGR